VSAEQLLIDLILRSLNVLTGVFSFHSDVAQLCPSIELRFLCFCVCGTAALYFVCYGTWLLLIHVAHLSLRASIHKDAANNSNSSETRDQQQQQHRQQQTETGIKLFVARGIHFADVCEMYLNKPLNKHNFI